MGISLSWMRADAPYMPIATYGLLVVLSDRDPDASALWTPDGGDRTLVIDTDLSVDEAAAAILEAPLPDTSHGDWPANGQSLRGALEGVDDPLRTFQGWVANLDGPQRLLMRTLATDQVLTKEGLPSRSRLLRGAKADLPPFRPLRKTTVEDIAQELLLGPDFRQGKSGTALGLVPELHTFGGTTGRQPQSIGAESALLSRLLRHGILHLPPCGGTVRNTRTVGGPLIAEDMSLSWPRWTIACGRRDLRVLFGLAAIHKDSPDFELLRDRGVDAVYRAVPRAISTTLSVFLWGSRVA